MEDVVPPLAPVVAPEVSERSGSTRPEASFHGGAGAIEDSRGFLMTKRLDHDGHEGFSADTPKPIAAVTEASTASGDNAEYSNLIVNYLPNDCSEDELRGLFEPHGEIEATKVVRDRATGISCGYGFVKFSGHEAASAALAALQGFGLRGKRLKISVALGPGRGMAAGDFPQNNLIVNYLTHDMTEERLLSLFGEHGEVESVKIVRDRETGMSLCYGFVKFKEDKAAQCARDAINGLDVGAKRLKVSVARPASGDLRHKKLYVSYIPRSYAREDVVRLFQRFGRILECRLLYDESGDSRCTAFVHMATKQAAEAALVLHGVQLQGACRGMVVKIAHNKNGREAEDSAEASVSPPQLYYGGTAAPSGAAPFPNSLAQQLQGLQLGSDSTLLPAYMMHAGGVGAAPSSRGHYRGPPPLKAHGYEGPPEAAGPFLSSFFSPAEVAGPSRMGMPYGPYGHTPHPTSLPGSYGAMPLRHAPPVQHPGPYSAVGYGTMSGRFYGDYDRRGKGV